MTNSPGRRATRWRRPAATAVCAIAALPILFLVLDALFPFPEHALRRPAAVVVTDRRGEPLRVFLPPDQTYRFPVALDEVSPHLKRAVIALEDRWFYFHPGVNPLAAARACLDNLRAGRVVSGASTLTMQIARMTDPAPRTLGAKLRESFRALQLEWRFDKDELLELYLNLAPYGGNIEGAGAAAAFWFSGAPDRLSPGQAALLAVLPRAPVAYDPAGRPRAARLARDRALRRISDAGVLTDRQVEDAIAEPLPSARRRPPFSAPHLSQLVADRSPGAPRIVSTLDRTIQRAAEQQVAARIAELRSFGVDNAAVVVIDNDTRAVRALVGSAGFHESAFAGQVNGALARRSPGSALKPFLYAAAIDEGVLVPDSYLLDVPTDFAGYVAENFDGRYRGRVTAREALARSLNAPAVRLLSKTGIEPMLQLLRRGGLSTLDRPASEYGLPLILGSGEVALVDLTNLYATLAQRGRHAAWRIAESSPPSTEAQLFSAESAGMIADVLAGLDRPDLPTAWDLTRDVPSVAWKTGTSYGHRDAWAIGFSAHRTIGVWVGNPDGRPREGLSGASQAAPLLFDLFRAIDGGATRLRETHAGRIERAPACALSRHAPGPFCPATEPILVVAGRTRLPVCSVHQRIFVDTITGERLTGDCLAGRSYKAEIAAVEPAELVAWNRSQGGAPADGPRLAAACASIPATGGPRIVSPSSTTPYRIRTDAPVRHQKIPLIATAGVDADRLYWYVDGELAAEGAPDATIFAPPSRGAHRLVVVDSAGRSDSITYRIE